MARARWGSLVAAAVGAVVGVGCSSQERRPAADVSVTPRKPEPAAPRSLSLSEGEPVDGVSVLPAYGALMARTSEAAIAHLALDEQLCQRAQALGEGCGFLRVLGGDGRWGEPLRVDRVWATLSAGGRGVYASRADAPLSLDFIDGEGRVQPVFEAGGASMHEVAVTEARSGLFVFGQEMKDEDAFYSDQPLSMQFLERRGDMYVSSARKRLPMVMSGALGTARDARYLARRARRVGYGEWIFSPALDAEGAPTDEALLVWTEAKIPRKAPPPRWDELGRGKNACKAVWRAMMMGCASSRPLSDRSITRTTRATLLNREGRVVREAIVPALPPGEPNAFGELDAPRVSVRAVAGGWLINGHWFDVKLAERAAPEIQAQTSLPSWDTARAETLITMAFSDEAGEGAVVVTQADAVRHATEATDAASYPRSLLRRFDAQGRWLAEPELMAGREVPEHASLVRLDDGWRTSTFSSLCAPSGVARCSSFAIDAEGADWCGPATGRVLLPDANTPSRMFFRSACEPAAVYAMGIDVAGWRYHSPRRLLPHGSITSVARDAAGHTWALLASADEDGTFVVDVDDPEARVKVSSSGAVLHQTGKHVVLRERGKGGRLVWLGTGVEKPAPDLAADDVARRKDGTSPVEGPLLPGGGTLLGDAPGAVVTLPEPIAAEARRCEQSVRTRAGAVLLLCTEPGTDAAHIPRVVLRRLDE